MNKQTAVEFEGHKLSSILDAMTNTPVNDPNYFAVRADAWLAIMTPAVAALAADCVAANPKRPDTPFGIGSRRV